MALPDASKSGMGLSFTPDAQSLCARQAHGRALALEFRQLNPSGCCSIGAVIRLNWRPLAGLASSSDLVNWGEVRGVPVYVHHVLRRFLTEHHARIRARSFGPFHWLTVESEKDPAMWCFFGDGPFEA